MLLLFIIFLLVFKLSDEYKNVYELINTECAQRKITSIDAKWCIANFQGEWFRLDVSFSS